MTLLAGMTDRPKLRFHDLCHANATRLVADGVEVETAQIRLGHSDARLTLTIYAQADKLGARFMRPCGMGVGLFGPRHPAPTTRKRP